MTQNQAKKLITDCIRILNESPKDVISIGELSSHMLTPEETIYQAKNSLPKNSRLWHLLLTAVENKLTNQLFKKDISQDYALAIYKKDFGAVPPNNTIESDSLPCLVMIEYTPTIKESIQVLENYKDSDFHKEDIEKLRELQKKVNEPKDLKGYAFIGIPGNGDAARIDQLRIPKGHKPIAKNRKDENGPKWL